MSNFWKSIHVLQPQLLTIIITTIIIVTICVIYRYKINKLRPYEAPKGLVLFIERIFTFMEDTVVNTMGHKFRWFTPYAIFLISYLGIGNLLSLTGIEGISANYTVVLTLGLVTFFGIYIVGIKFQKLGFALKYVKDPTYAITQFSPLISITFRMFGNITAGSVILALFYMLTANAAIPTGVHINSQSLVINILGGIFSPPLHFYFDIFDGMIQTYIFTLLTLSYIGQEADAEAHGSKKVKLPKTRFAGSATNSIYENIDIVRYNKFNIKNNN